MTQITIKELNDFPHSEFDVTIHGSTVTKHKITLAQAYYENLTGGDVSAKELVEASFKFLLAREPNTSILSEFDLRVISNYFPAYEQEMKSKFRSS